MSSLTINGKVIFSTVNTTVAPSATTTPSFATHRLIDGHWVAKGSATPSAPTTPPRPIGFIQPTPSAPTKGSVPYLGNRREYLRAIEVAAGHTLLKGTNQKAIEAIRRGRLGGRKDNMAELHQLLQEYSA